MLILKGLSWLLMARFTPYSRAVMAQMWPRGRERKAAIQCLCRGRGRVSCYASVVLLSIAFTKFQLKQLEAINLSLVVPLVPRNLIPQLRATLPRSLVPVLFPMISRLTKPATRLLNSVAK